MFLLHNRLALELKKGKKIEIKNVKHKVKVIRETTTTTKHNETEMMQA